MGGREEQQKHSRGSEGDVAWLGPTTTLVGWGMQHIDLCLEP